MSTMLERPIHASLLQIHIANGNFVQIGFLECFPCVFANNPIRNLPLQLTIPRDPPSLDPIMLRAIIETKGNTGCIWKPIQIYEHNLLIYFNLLYEEMVKRRSVMFFPLSSRIPVDNWLCLFPSQLFWILKNDKATLCNKDDTFMSFGVDNLCLQKFEHLKNRINQLEHARQIRLPFIENQYNQGEIIFFLHYNGKSELLHLSHHSIHVLREVALFVFPVLKFSQHFKFINTLTGNEIKTDEHLSLIMKKSIVEIIS